MAAVVNVVPAMLLCQDQPVPGGYVVQAVAPALHDGRMWVSLRRPDGTLAEAEVPNDWPVPVITEAVDR